MHIEATETFIKLYKRLPGNIQEQTKKALHLLENSPHHPSLGHKKMAGQKNIYECRINIQYRLTYERRGDTAYLRKVGTHDLLNNP